MCFQQIFKGKRVFITGHTGFKGAWLTLWLKHLGAEVRGYSLDFPSSPLLFSETRLEEDMGFVEEDVRDYEKLVQAVKDFQPQVVFHLAAQAIVQTCLSNPREAFSCNLMGTVNVLNLVKEMPGIEACVFITSDKCYENVEWVYGYRENDTLGGKDPYSASKAAAELAYSAFVRSYELPPTATARAGNVIGGGDWANKRIIPDCMRAWSRGEILNIRHPHATRPWQHVLEPLSGYLHLAATLLQDLERKVSGESFNFGPHETQNISVEELINGLKAYWPGRDYQSFGDYDEREAGLLKLTCDKAKSKLCWHAVLNFEETVKFTGRWYHDYYQKNISARELVVRDIQEYEGLAKERGLVWAE